MTGTNVNQSNSNPRCGNGLTPPATQLNPVFRVTWRSCAWTQSLQTPELLPIGCTPRAARSGRWPDAIGPPPRPEDQVRFSTKSPSPANWPGKVQTGSPPPPSVCSRIFRAHPYAPEPSSIPHHARITKGDTPTNARRTQIPQIPFPARPESDLPEIQECRLTVALRLGFRF